MTISKNDYKLLIKLLEDDCTTEMRSYSIKKIMEVTDLSMNKVRTAIRTFLLIGLVQEGCVAHNAKTYFITQSGIQKIKSL